MLILRACSSGAITLLTGVREQIVHCMSDDVGSLVRKLVDPLVR